MERLRVISALEHEVIPIADGAGPVDGAKDTAWISKADASTLVSLNHLRKGFCEQVAGGVKLAQHCGIVRLPSCVLELLPKLGISDTRKANELDRSRAALLNMLHHARQITITNAGAVPQRTVNAPLLDVFIDTFLGCALEQARRGLLARYVTHVDDLSVLKGRLHVHGHIRRNLTRPHLLHCEHDDFTADNTYNRAIRATLNTCQSWGSHPSTRRRWFETHARFAGITSVSMTAADVARLPRNRTTLRYEPVLKWCEWLLSMNSPSMSAGATHAPGLLFDMNKLFEAHVSRLEKMAAGEAYVVSTQGPKLALATSNGEEAFELKPDVIIWHPASDGVPTTIVRILDAKWKRLDHHDPRWGVQQTDIYQLLAYAIRYRCRHLELVYPAPSDNLIESNGAPFFEIMAPGLDEKIEVRIKTVSV